MLLFNFRHKQKHLIYAEYFNKIRLRGVASSVKEEDEKKPLTLNCEVPLSSDSSRAIQSTDIETQSSIMNGLLDLIESKWSPCPKSSFSLLIESEHIYFPI